MSNAFMDDIEYDDSEGYDDAEVYDDSEGYDDAESRASRAKRRRARALAIARQRTAARQARPAPPPSGPRAVVNAVKELDLQTQVQQDSLRSVLASQNRKLDQANLAAVATVLIAEGFRAFGTPDNTFVRAAIQASPLWLLPTGQPRHGVSGYLARPGVPGTALALGLAFLGEQQQRGTTVATVTVLGPTSLAVGSHDIFVADVLDARGRPSTVAPEWSSDVQGIASIDPTSGRVVANSVGVAIISAKAGDVTRRARLEVVDPSRWSTPQA
jgi:hypothetical protein